MVIDLKIENESELYCRFNSNHELSEEVTTYIIDQLSTRNKGEAVELRIISKTPINEDNVNISFEAWIASIDAQLKKESKTNFVKQL